MKRLLMLLMCFFIFAGCNGEDKDEGDGPEKDKIEDDDVIATIENPSGRVEAASCLGYSFVYLSPYDVNFDQTGERYFGETSGNNTGEYEIPVQIVGATHGQYDFEGYCRRETTSGKVEVKMRLVTAFNTPEKNLNFPGTIQSLVALKHFRNPLHANYQNIDGALLTAKTEVLDFFDMPTITKDFPETTIQGDTIDDAVTTMISATIDHEKDEGFVQNDFVIKIAEGIVDNDLTLKEEVNSITQNLPIKAIIDNINSIFTELDLTADPAPIQNLPNVPWYYADILNRTPAVLDVKNTDYINLAPIDVADYNIFAYPVQFTNTGQNYIALNLQNAVSIWTVKTCLGGYYCPDAKIADLTLLNEVLLEDPIKTQYNYSITGNIESNVKYFVRQEFDELTAPSKLIQGDMVPFGSSLASIDGVNWIDGNTHNWFTRSILYYTTN